MNAYVIIKTYVNRNKLVLVWSLELSKYLCKYALKQKENTNNQ